MNLMEDMLAKVWAARLGVPDNFTVALVRLDMLELQMQQTGKTGLAEFYLTPEEQRRFFGFTYRKRQTEWFGGRICAKYAAARLLHPDCRTEAIPWRDWTVSADEHGKPFLKPGQCDISISHSGRLAVAMAAPVSCGIDIQKITPTVVKVQDRFSSADERLLLAAAPGLKTADEMTRLTVLWSAKEAVRKAFAASPLPGFMEIEQARIDGSLDGREGLLIDFVCQRDNPSAHRLQVMAMLYDDFAFALAFSAERNPLF